MIAFSFFFMQSLIIVQLAQLQYTSRGNHLRSRNRHHMLTDVRFSDGAFINRENVLITEDIGFGNSFYTRLSLSGSIQKKKKITIFKKDITLQL